MQTIRETTYTEALGGADSSPILSPKRRQSLPTKRCSKKQGVLWIRISLRQLEYVYVQFLAGNADQQTQISVSYVSVKTYFGARFSSSFARLAWSIVAIGNRWLWDTVTRRYSQLLDAWREGTIP